MRIAFLTPEYPSELLDAGGLATYVHRMAQALQEFGHEPEVFVTARNQSGDISYEGVLVHRVGRESQPKILGLGYRTSRRLVRSSTLNGLIELFLNASALARALERRHAQAPFDLVQSAASQGAGLFVRRRPGRAHAVRCSYDSLLWSTFDQYRPRITFVRGFLERLAMRRADVAYVPSRFLADYISRKYGIKLQVVRPPFHFRNPEPSPLPFVLPSRFFIHFGQIRRLKGSALLAEALPIAWKSAPDLAMVWSGRCYEQLTLERWQASWGERAAQVVITGPLPRSQLYGVLQRADAAVLPSQADNLPNTVIESLSLGIPVLGSRGASIDELVEEGVHGHLVELGDAQALARALVRMWRGETPVSKGFNWRSTIVDEMNPQTAVRNLLGLYQSNIAN